MAEEAGEERVVRAGPRARLLVIVAWVACVVVGTALILWVIPAGQAHLEEQEPATALRYIQVLLAVIFLSLVPVAAYLLWFGWRVVRSGQMPPPGTKVIGDTIAVEGDAAETRGRIIVMLAGVLLLLALVGGLYLPYRFGQLFGNKLQRPQKTVEPNASEQPAP
jgi:threonine/homoserine/homoserine lactone efflux protein